MMAGRGPPLRGALHPPRSGRGWKWSGRRRRLSSELPPAQTSELKGRKALFWGPVGSGPRDQILSRCIRFCRRFARVSRFACKSGMSVCFLTRAACKTKCDTIGPLPRAPSLGGPHWPHHVAEAAAPPCRSSTPSQPPPRPHRAHPRPRDTRSADRRPQEPLHSEPRAVTQCHSPRLSRLRGRGANRSKGAQGVRAAARRPLTTAASRS